MNNIIHDDAWYSITALHKMRVFPFVGESRRLYDRFIMTSDISKKHLKVKTIVGKVGKYANRTYVRGDSINKLIAAASEFGLTK